jgi:hypothetical protein
MRDIRSYWPHAKWNNIHRSAFHTSLEKLHHSLLHFFRIDPIIGWSG